MNISTPKNRKSLLKSIRPEEAKSYHQILLEVLKLEILYRADDQQLDDDDEDFYENIYWCGLLLYCIGDLNDIDIMWKAKHVNMDTGCGFDVQFLVGAGVDRTIEYLRKDFDKKKILEYISECKECDDFEDMEEWKEFKINYFYE